MPTAALLALLAGYGGVLPIEGVYGNRDGCHYYLTGEIDGALMILTSDTLASPEAACDFRALTATRDGSFTLDAVCSGKGDFAGNPDTVTVTEGGAAGYFVTLGGLPELGPFIPCVNFPEEDRA